jgi:hypothetical protein
MWWNFLGRTSLYDGIKINFRDDGLNKYNFDCCCQLLSTCDIYGIETEIVQKYWCELPKLPSVGDL